MGDTKSYFFSGIGGSGMLPLATIVRGQGHRVAGSDRALDQGRTADKFDYLKRQGIALFPQDGSGITGADQIVVTSAAIEETVPDVIRTHAIGATRITRPQLLAELFNAAPVSIAVGGTSGKSTVTGMIGWILHHLGRKPTVMNGAVMKNFVTSDVPFASALVGDGEIFVSEVDESDGSISLYRPKVAVLGNITLDHKSMDELRSLFRDFITRSENAVLNLDDAETRRLLEGLPGAKPLLTFSLEDPAANFTASAIHEEPFAISFEVKGTAVRLQVPGRHNVSNALAALAAVSAFDIGFAEAAAALAKFRGLRRRFDIVGTRGGITVIDDFGHNPDKIAATLDTLHAFPGRLLVLFQPHGYGPLKTLRQPLIDTFAGKLADGDLLVMPDPVYYGGTTDRSIGSADIIGGVQAAGRHAEHIPARADAGERLRQLAQAGDRIVIMGARDDTLPEFAAELLASL